MLDRLAKVTLELASRAPLPPALAVARTVAKLTLLFCGVAGELRGLASCRKGGGDHAGTDRTDG
jgi:hypothetical protein